MNSRICTVTLIKRRDAPFVRKIIIMKTQIIFQFVQKYPRVILYSNFHQCEVCMLLYTSVTTLGIVQKFIYFIEIINHVEYIC